MIENIDWMMVLTIVTSVIAGASIILKVVAPLTKTDVDNKILKVLLKILAVISLHTPDNDNKLTVNVRAKK